MIEYVASETCQGRYLSYTMGTKWKLDTSPTFTYRNVSFFEVALSRSE